MPEKEFTAAYNLLIYLVLQSPNVNMFLPKICENLSKPIVSSLTNGPGLALNGLTTIFNLLRPDNEVRFNVFQAILRLVKMNGLFELLRPQLFRLDIWLQEWNVEQKDRRKLFIQIADVAEDVAEEECVVRYGHQRQLLIVLAKPTSTFLRAFVLLILKTLLIYLHQTPRISQSVL